MSFRKITMGRAIGSEKVDKDNTGKTVWQYNTYGPDKDPNWYKWGIFEASSIRKIGNKYVYIYSRTNQIGLERIPAETSISLPTVTVITRGDLGNSAELSWIRRASYPER